MPANSSSISTICGRTTSNTLSAEAPRLSPSAWTPSPVEVYLKGWESKDQTHWWRMFLLFQSLCPFWTPLDPWIRDEVLSSLSTWVGIAFSGFAYPSIIATSLPTNQGSPFITIVLTSPKLSTLSWGLYLRYMGTDLKRTWNGPGTEVKKTWKRYNGTIVQHFLHTPYLFPVFQPINII